MFFIYFSLFFSVILQVFSIYLLSSGSVFLTYQGYDVTDYWALIFIFALCVNLTRALLVRQEVIDIFSKNILTNFFLIKFFPKLSFFVSVLTIFIFSGFRKLIFLQNQLLDSTTFWGNTMIHKRYDFQTRAEYFDKLVFQRKLDVPFGTRTAILDSSNTMSDIFDNVLGLQKYYVQEIEDYEHFITHFVIAFSLITAVFFFKWFFRDDGNSSVSGGIGEVDAKQLSLDERVSNIELFFKGLAETSKDSTLVEMSLSKDPLRFGKVIGVLLDSMSKGLSGHDEALVDTLRLFCRLPPYKPKFVPFSGYGERLGSDTSASQGASVFSSDTIKNFIKHKLFGYDDPQ